MTGLYPQGASHILGKSTQINFLTDTFKVLFYAGSYNSSHEYVSDLTGASIVVRSGALSGAVVSNGTVAFNNFTVSSVTGSAFSVVILYKTTGVDSSSPLIAEYGITTFTPTGTDISVIWNPSGAFSIA